MKKNLSSIIAAFTGASLLLIPTVGSSAVLVNYPFTTPTNATSWPSSEPAQPGTSVTEAASGNPAYVRSTTSANVFYQFPTSPGQLTKEQAIAANYYVEFTVTPDAGYSISYSDLSFNYGGSTSFAAGGPTFQANFFVRSNLDAYATDLAAASYTVPGGAGGANVPELLDLDLSALSAFQALDTAATFRIYAFTSNFSGPYSSSALPRIDNLQLLGSVQAIPEPSTVALLMAAMGGLAVFSRHRRTRVGGHR